MSVVDVTSSVDAARRIEELGRIILAYSEVTEKLQQSHDRLEQTVRTLGEELSEKNRQLERRNRLAALGEMAAGMAHEIRNPLGGIQLYASLLAKDVEDRPESHRLVEKISAGVRRLESLVSQVMQFTREIRTAMVPADLAEVIDQAVEMAAQAVQAKQIQTRIRGPRPMEVRIDPLLMGQALLNLVLNSVEAMGAGGMVEIEFGLPREGSDEKQLYLVVQDTGPGIPSQIIDRIFNPFFTTKDTGTGLGLAIVHRIVEAHDGAITAGNCPTGGARFEIRI
ncbi:MAG: sensor histidine kinase [Bacillota bacterium]